MVSVQKRGLSRLLAVAMSVCILLSCLSLTVFAAERRAADFTDLDVNNWAYGYIDDVVTRGYFYGTSSTTFSPDVRMSRAMFVAVLARYAEAELNDNVQTRFSDVPTGEYYTGAVVWAAENEIVKGTSDTTFDPHGAISREDMIVMIIRYVDFLEINLPVDAEDFSFVDEGTISDYAADDVERARSSKLVLGFTDGTFRPQATSSRSEVAAVISRIRDIIDSIDPDTPLAGIYTVSFNSNGGSAVEEQLVEEGELAVKPANPSRSGYSFGGWYTDQTLSEAYDFATPVTESFILYAKWNGGGGGGTVVVPPVTPKEQSEAPDIYSINEIDTVIKGTGVADASLTVTFPDGATATTTVDADGDWSVAVPVGTILVPGEKVTAVQTEPGKTVSPEASETVQPMPVSEAPEINPVYDDSRTITGTGVPGAELTVTFPEGSTGTAIVDTNGEWSVLVPAGVTLVAGQEVSAVQTEPGKTVSPEATETVLARPRHSEMPWIDVIYENDISVTGSGIPGAELIVTFPNGSTVDTTVDAKGAWFADVPASVTLAKGEVIKATQTEPGKLRSGEVTQTVFADLTPIKYGQVSFFNQNTGVTSATSGDIIQFRGSAENHNLNIASTWGNAAIVIELDSRLKLDLKSVKINEKPSTAYHYDSGSHSLTLYLGSISGGDIATFSFTQKVSDHQTIANLQNGLNFSCDWQ